MPCTLHFVHIVAQTPQFFLATMASFTLRGSRPCAAGHTVKHDGLTMPRQFALAPSPVFGSHARRTSHVASHNRLADIQLGWPSQEQFYDDDSTAASSSRSIDVLGLGQAMIDFGACVDASWLADLQLEKGARK